MTIASHRVRSGILCGLIAASAGLGGCGQADREGAIVEPDPVGGPPLVRRLTEAQYRATVADIFASDIPVAARFERPHRSEGLIAVGTSEAGMSAVSIEQYDAAAMSVADAVLGQERRAEFVPCTPQDEATFDEACASRFVEQYGPRLFRRPLVAEQLARLLDAAREGTSKLGNFHEGLKYALVGMMTSPEFLLRIERAEADPEHPDILQLDAYSKATRLSYFLTNSTPDPELMRAAAEGELNTREALALQVDRLIGSPRFEGAVREFFRDMLEFELFEELEKDSQLYPQYNSEVAKDAQEQTLRTIIYHLVENQGDYRDLFTLRETFLTRALSTIYRMPVAARHGWEKKAFRENDQRAGIQSHVSFLALHSHPGRSSPTLRGKAIRNVFLCQEVPEPPANVNFSVVQDSSNTDMPTARDRLQVHNTEPACSGCHNIMDPPGLALENFDGVGIVRTRENGAVIDAGGVLDSIPYEDVRGFAQALRDHPETASCLAEKMYRYAVGRDTEWGERYYMDYLIETFERDGHRVPDLMRKIAQSKSFFAISTPSDAENDHRQANLTTYQEDQI